MSYSEGGDTGTSRAARLLLLLGIAFVVLALPASCLFLPFIAGG